MADDTRKQYLRAAGDVVAAAGALQDAVLALVAASARCAPGAGGLPGHAVQMAAGVATALQNWKMAEPAVFGLGEPLTREEAAMIEAERSLKLAKERLAWAKDVARRQDVPENWGTRIESYQAGIAFWERQIRRLKGIPEPEPAAPTMSDVDNLAMRMGSFEKARRALGLPTKEPEAFPPIPTMG